MTPAAHRETKIAELLERFTREPITGKALAIALFEAYDAGGARTIVEAQDAVRNYTRTKIAEAKL